MYGTHKSKGATIKVPILPGNKDTQETVIPLVVIKKRYCLVCRGRGWTKRWFAKDGIATRLQCSACNGKGFVRRLPVELASAPSVALPAETA